MRRLARARRNESRSDRHHPSDRAGIRDTQHGADHGLQSKLLRVLQEREIEPSGAERTVPIDVRVVTATNRDLRRLVAAGSFQEDLFYRLNVIPIVVPPLRDRLEDIPLLVDYFVSRHAGRSGTHIHALERGAIELLQSHTWPGNVRELENTIERGWS